MAHLSSIEQGRDVRTRLLLVARQAIEYSLRGESRGLPALEQLPASLKTKAAVFVTLTRNKQLRGCIGSLQAVDILVNAVAEAAMGAAFRDPRFPPVQADELGEIEIEISVLSPLRPLVAASREELLQKLRPGLDGLLLENDDGNRATFLPKVWQQLPTPELFLEHLMAKAGLPMDHWSGELRFARYRTLCFDESG
jgi:AmmeMemoRadiSam system protein A